MIRSDSSPNDAATVALQALSFTLNNPLLAARLVDVTGLTPDNLRGRLGEPAVLAAVLTFLEGHEPDLLACAEALNTTPAALVAARGALEATA